MFFWQIWSQKLKFFKLTEIWYRGRLPYAYFDFNGYFFKIFIILIFLGKLSIEILGGVLGQKQPENNSF